MPLSRRRFLELTAAASVASALPHPTDAERIDPVGTGTSGAGAGPLIVASRNGLRGVELAYRLMHEEGADPLDAAIEAAKIQELDPEDTSVGLGGLPNEDGILQLDASCMHGPTKRARAAGSTGRGEANLKVCGAFLVVEAMRQGLSPMQACLQALQRSVEMTEERLLDGHGRPRFELSFYAISKAGEFGSATMYEPTAEQKERGGGAFAVADAKGARLETMAFLYSTAERPR